MKLRKSWVWQYATRKGDKAYCELCHDTDDNEFSCTGGTTGSLGRHLMTIHGVHKESDTASREQQLVPS